MPIWWYVQNAKLSMGAGSLGRWAYAAVAVALAACVSWYLFRSGSTAVSRRRGLLMAIGAALVMLALSPLVWPSATGR
jgi:hypothetical protein